ncbi:hypothetical protein GGF32_002210 [Allomyces javanicus]|nr:hypothetical protein GGF32_002210 [Allomyces javanicus]
MDIFIRVQDEFMNLASMRRFVKTMWAEYGEGKITLVTASLVTTTDLDSVRAAEVALTEIDPKLVEGGTIEMIHIFFQSWFRDYLKGAVQTNDWTATTLFLLNPWLCGGILLKLQQAAVDVIVDPLAPSRITMYAPHLYEACRTYARDNGMADLFWPDMEMFMDLYGREDLFAGRVPDTLEDRGKWWYLMAGASVTTPLPSHLVGRTTRSKHDLRFAREVLDALHCVIADLMDSGTVSPAFCTRTLNHNFAGRPMPSLIEELGLAPEAIAVLRKTNRRLDVVTLLKFVRTIVHEERKLLNFNHISMHMRCLDLVDEIKEPCYARFIAQFDNFDTKPAVYPACIVRQGLANIFCGRLAKYLILVTLIHMDGKKYGRQPT